MSLLGDWLLANKLSLSIGHNKDTKYSFFSPHKINTQQLPTLKIFNIEILRTPSVKYLGVYLDEKLTFENHIKHLESKINKYTGIFYNIRSQLPLTALKMVYFSFIFSNIFYCADIYGNTHSKFIEGLQKVHNKSLRALQNKNRYYPVNQLHKDYNVLKVKDVIFYKSMLNIFNIINNPQSVPNIIVDQITLNPHQYPTRSKRPLMVKSNNTVFGSKLMSGIWSRIWNSLPDSIQKRHPKKHSKNFWDRSLTI